MSSVKSNTIPHRATYYQEPYKENNGKDDRRGSCREYSIEPTYESDNFSGINHGPIRAPMLPPIERSSRLVRFEIEMTILKFYMKKKYSAKTQTKC